MAGERDRSARTPRCRRAATAFARPGVVSGAVGPVMAPHVSAVLRERAACVTEQAELVTSLLRLPYLRVDQVADVAQVSAHTVRRACRSGALAAIRLGARQWRVTPDAVRAWLAGGTKAGNPLTNIAGRTGSDKGVSRGSDQ